MAEAEATVPMKLYFLLISLALRSCVGILDIEIRPIYIPAKMVGHLDLWELYQKVIFPIMIVIVQLHLMDVQNTLHDIES